MAIIASGDILRDAGGATVGDGVVRHGVVGIVAVAAAAGVNAAVAMRC